MKFGTIIRLPILMAVVFLGFILLVGNLPAVECVGQGSIHNQNRFSALAESVDEIKGPKEETEINSALAESVDEIKGPKEENEIDSSTAIKNDGVRSSKTEKEGEFLEVGKLKRKLKMKGIVGESSGGQEQQENTEKTEFKINMKDLTIFALYFYKNPPQEVKRQSDKDKAWELLKKFILKKYKQRIPDELKLSVAEKEKNDKDITEQINLILDKNVERKCEEYEHELSEFVDQPLLRNLLVIMEKKYGNSINIIQKKKKIFGIYLYKHNLIEKQDGQPNRIMYKMTDVQRYRLNGQIDKIYFEYLENNETEPVFWKKFRYHESMHLPRVTVESSESDKESGIVETFLRNIINDLIEKPTNKMKATYHKLNAIFEISFGLYMKEKQRAKKVDSKKLDQTILKILFEGIGNINEVKSKLRKLIYEEYISNENFFETVRKGELDQPMKTIFTKYIKQEKIDLKRMLKKSKIQLNSLIYEKLFEKVYDGFDLNFGDRIVKEIDQELHSTMPYDETQHYAPQIWNWWHSTPAVPFIQHDYSGFFPPLPSAAVQTGHLFPPAANPQTTSYSGTFPQLASAAHGHDYYGQQSLMPSTDALTYYSYYDYEQDRQIQEQFRKQREQQEKLKEERKEQFNKLRDGRGYAAVALAGTDIRIGKPPSPLTRSKSTSAVGGAADLTSRHHSKESTSKNEDQKKSWADEIEEAEQKEEKTTKLKEEEEKDTDQKEEKTTKLKEGETYASILLKSASAHHPENVSKTHGAVGGIPETEAGKSNVDTTAEHYKKAEQMQMGKIIPPRTKDKGILGAKPASITAKASAKGQNRQ